MKKLSEKMLQYSMSIVRDWNDTSTHAKQEYQHRYLYKQALGATQMSVSYWQLFHVGQHDARRLVARHLLERVFNSRVAKILPELAAELICYDLNERITKMKLWLEENARLEPLSSIRKIGVTVKLP